MEGLTFFARDRNWSLAIVIIVIIDIRAGFRFAVAIKCGEECRDSGTAFQESGQEPLNEDGNSNLRGGIVHTPDAGPRLGQVGVHLNEVPFAESQRDGDFF